MQTLEALMATLPQTGRVEWIGLRPGRDEPIAAVDQVDASVDGGLAGDRYSKAGGKRQVTLIQAEHLEALASLLDIGRVEPDAVRRNLVVRGINLLAMKDKQFHVGDAVLEFTGLCHPCSKMERELGPGGYNAMRGHGGITARVVAGGTIARGSPVSILVNPQ